MALSLVDMLSPHENVRTDIFSGTQACVLYQVKDVVCNTQFVLIDTPGYGDPKRDDVEILTMIRDCINSEECPSISGIVYFQRVTDTRMSSSSEVYNLGVVKTICGEKFYSHIVISTSMWDTLHPNIPAAHEKARERIQCLLNAPTGLGPLNKAGAVHMQFWGEDSSAQGILQLFASMGPAPRLAFQEQLAQNKPGVRKTDAGRFIGEETKRRAPEKMDEKRRQGAQDEDITSPRRDSKLSIGSA